MREIEPERIQPLRGYLLVKRYERPEEYGGLVLPGSHQRDHSGKLWELAVEAEDVLGVERLPKGTIVEIRLSAPGDPGAVRAGFVDVEDGRSLWVLDPEKIYGVLPADWEDGDD